MEEMQIIELYVSISRDNALLLFSNILFCVTIEGSSFYKVVLRLGTNKNVVVFMYRNFIIIPNQVLQTNRLM